MSNPKYDKSRDRENYTFHPGKQFHAIFLDDPGSCYLLALDHRQLSLLREMCAVFPKYHWVWGLSSPRSGWDAATQQTWQDITDFVEELEATLLSGCDLQAFIDAAIDQAAAIRELTAVVADLELSSVTNVDIDMSGVEQKLTDIETAITALELSSVTNIDTTDVERHLQVIAAAIKEAQTVINVNNINGCCDEEDCDCGDVEEQTITIDEEDC
ncbi:MAG: hypothetical protein KDJ52_01720 [Anaerolineae bacterium]|nr:hypothetical protein [Anaerolineae bacterium]